MEMDIVIDLCFRSEVIVWQILKIPFSVKRISRLFFIFFIFNISRLWTEIPKFPYLKLKNSTPIQNQRPIPEKSHFDRKKQCTVSFTVTQSSGIQPGLHLVYKQLPASRKFRNFFKRSVDR